MADGKIVFDTAVDQSGMKKDLADIQSSMGGLKRSLGRIAGLMATAFSIREVVRFGKACIDLGSDLNEVQNVVDVTFGSMREQANQFAQSALFSAGLSETMAKRYMGTFGAMSKAFGFAEDEAYNMAAALTQLSGDVASFYNISQDEAFTKLKSVFTGETESLKDLGIVMTQAALDQYALANGFGRTTKNMTEQEKVALRHQFVLQQLSLASGDFIRTSNGWANQTRILSVQFEQLKSTIGQGFINALTPVIRIVNTVISRLQVLANVFRSVTATLFGDANAGESGVLGGAASDLNSAAGGADDLAGGLDSAGAAAKKAKRELAGFDELTRLSDPSAGGGGGGGGGGAVGAGALDLGFDPAQRTVIEQEVDTMVQNIMRYLEPLQNIDFSNLQLTIENLKANFGGLGESIRTALDWVYFNVLVPLAQWTIEEAAPASVDAFNGFLEMLKATLDALGPAFRAVYDAVQPVFKFLGDTACTVLRLLSDLFRKVAATVAEKSPQIEKIIQGVGEIFGIVWNDMLQPALEGFIEFFAWVFDLAGDIAATTMGGIIDVFSGWTDFLTGVFTGDWSRAWDGIKEIFTGFWNWIKGILDDILAAFDTSFGDIKDNLIEDFKAIKEGIKRPINGIIGFVNKMISGVVSGINSITGALNRISIKLPDWLAYVPGASQFAGKQLGFSIGRINAPQIPYLAQGAVLPPNRPFMAVVGDQRHGTNVEAPLETIQEAVANVMGGMQGGMMAGFEQTIEILRSILEAILGIEIGDEVIGEAVRRYDRKMNIVRGI